jgi:hypothetical protein
MTATRSLSVATLFIVGTFISAPLVLSGSSEVVGTGAILHRGSESGPSISCRDYEAVQLRFEEENGQTALTIDFVPRENDLPPEQRIVEVFVASQQPPGRAPSHVTLQVNHRPYPLATNVDSRGVVKSVMSLESFVNLAMTSTIQGTAFGERFVATDRQMLTLQLALSRWAAQDFATPLAAISLSRGEARSPGRLAQRASRDRSRRRTPRTKARL